MLELLTLPTLSLSVGQLSETLHDLCGLSLTGSCRQMCPSAGVGLWSTAASSLTKTTHLHGAHAFSTCSRLVPNPLIQSPWKHFLAVIHVRQKRHSEKTQDKTLRDIEHSLNADNFWTCFACSASRDSLVATLQIARAAKHGGHPKAAGLIFPMHVRGVIRGRFIGHNLVLSSNLG